jgi:hypothetical protein
MKNLLTCSPFESGIVVKPSSQMMPDQSQWKKVCAIPTCIFPLNGVHPPRHPPRRPNSVDRHEAVILDKEASLEFATCHNFNADVLGVLTQGPE